MIMFMCVYLLYYTFYVSLVNVFAHILYEYIYTYHKYFTYMSFSRIVWLVLIVGVDLDSPKQYLGAFPCQDFGHPKWMLHSKGILLKSP